MLEEDAYKILKDKIIKGEFSAGSVLSEISVSEELGMSRTPTRGALNKLTSEGFITQKKGHFSTVRVVTPKDIHNFFEFCLILEQYAVKKIYKDIENFDLEIINTANKMQKKALQENDMDSYYIGDHMYHMAFINFLNNQEISTTVENMWEKICMVANSQPQKWNSATRSQALKTHENVYELLLKKGELEIIIQEIQNSNEDAKKRLLLI